MKRKRPETTIYLGDEVLKKLQVYRSRFPHPPSLSSIVREAVEQYIVEQPEDRSVLSPSAWVEMTEADLLRLRAKKVYVTTEQILSARQRSEDERIRSILGGDER